ncbi:MAG: 23S rRNA (guanosine(2251)-2'-O)-methyltransferase RlmB [Wenzhouxiangella sp.]|jgi:23S rRNA (guanosine2251-2'-O)-methyltransferase|nr:23S rRNA (guanosine(2251)-2'-O)-methyltransferase RlmB [Wenzhouxiangella sp.]
MKREIIAGINAVDGLLDTAPESICRVWLNPSSKRLVELQSRLTSCGIAVEECDARALDRRSQGVRHQGVVAEFKPRSPLGEADLEELLSTADLPLVLVLDGIHDPHNLGACMRSAAAAGALAVVVPKDRAVGLTPVARRASAGASERVPLVVVTNLARCLRGLQDRGLWRVGLAGEAEGSLYQAHLDGPLALVLGGEERGLRRLTRENCDQLVRIPMPGSTESLNVSVSAGIALFEALRIRGVDA